VFIAVVAVWFGFHWLLLALSEGNSEEIFFRIRVGMSRENAVAVLRSVDRVDGRYSYGKTIDGRSFYHPGHDLMDDLPPPKKLASYVLAVSDDYGRELEVVIGPRDTVTDKRLSPGFVEYPLQLDRIYRCVYRAFLDTLDRDYARDFAKHWPSFRKRQQYIVPGLAVGLALVAAWRLRVRGRGAR
jgi:hypothetical protein